MKSEKRYSFWSLVVIFFGMSLAGWLWEVSLHLFAGGGFVNRGFLHGPWLPIYGFGSVLIVTLFYRLRSKPFLEFLAIILLCGGIEYYISWLLEKLYHGMKWWDYSGYFLNVNGRICAEGLLTFGAGGMLLVYVLAPFLDQCSKRIPRKVLVPVCLALTFVFCVDLIYSVGVPNTGNGITRHGL